MSMKETAKKSYYGTRHAETAGSGIRGAVGIYTNQSEASEASRIRMDEELNGSLPGCLV